MQEYCRRHRLEEVVSEVLSEAIKSKANDPLKCIADSLRTRAGQNADAAQRVRDLLQTDRVTLPKGVLGSESSDDRLKLPAELGSTGRLLLGDLGHCCALLGDSTPELDAYFARKPVSAVLVCMGAEAAASVEKEFRKRSLTYKGLDGCVDQEGYPLIAMHLHTAVAFIREQLAASAPGGCVLVHCHEGKNRSGALSVAYLVAEERMPLHEAVSQVFSRRPIVLDNGSFVEQLIALATAEGLLT